MTNAIVNLSSFAGAGAQFFDNNGIPLSAGTLATYAAGTTTNQATYTTPIGNVQNSNPIVLNSSGRTPQEIWLLNGYSYKFVLSDASGSVIGTYDNIPSTSSNLPIINDASSVAYEQGYTVTAGSFVVGQTYLITSVGTTNFTAIGATSNTVGIYFVATGVGSGTGTAQLSRTVQSKLQEYVSVKDYGALGNNSADDTAAIQAALNASNFVTIPSGTYLVSSQITISANTTLVIKGTISPKSNPSTATSFFYVSGSNVNIIFESGSINGISSSYSNFTGGISVNSGSNPTINNVNISNGYFTNIGINNGGTPITYTCVTNGKILGNTIVNCGQLANQTFIGFGIYLGFCNAILVDGNILNNVGSTGINNSGGLNCIITNNNINTVSLFGFKGGYIQNIATVTSNVTPTLYSFSVAYSATVLKNLQPGLAVVVENSTYPASIGYIGAVTATGTSYITVSLNAPMNVVPTTGSSVHILETGTVYADNTLHFTGDNGWDINGWANITVIGNSLYSPGVYQGAGVFGGLACGFWFGQDAIAGYTYSLCQDLLISGNSITNSYGTSISVQATSNNVNIANNLITNPNRSNNSSFGGIDLGQYSTNRSNNQIVTGNIITNGYGFGINNNYSQNVSITNNQIYSDLGIKVSAQNNCVIDNNTIVTSNTSGSAYGILTYLSGSVSSGGISIANNTINVSGGYGINNSDTGFSLNTVFNGNLIGGSGTYTAFSNNGADIATPASVNGANQLERHVTQYLTGQTITFSEILASTANFFLLTVLSEQSSASGITGLYLISRSTTQAHITAISACSDVTVALNGSYQVTVTNVTGGSRTLSASISVLQ